MNAGKAEQNRASFPFPRSVRLLQHAAFDRVYREGARVFSGNLTVFFRRRDETETVAGPRVGFTVSRALGEAVQRNRMKRRLRASVRHHLAVLEGPVDVVINPKKSLLSAEFSQLMREIERAFTQIRHGDVKAVASTRRPAARTRRP